VGGKRLSFFGTLCPSQIELNRFSCCSYLYLF